VLIPVIAVSALAVTVAAAAAPNGEAPGSAASPTWPFAGWEIPTSPAPALTLAPMDVLPPDPRPAPKVSTAAVVPRTKAETAPVAAAYAAMGIPAPALRAYKNAAKRMAARDRACGMSWQLLAAIGRVETGHGTSGPAVMTKSGLALPFILGPILDGAGPFALIRDSDQGTMDGNTEFDRAVGPMQFLPSTWANIKRDGDRDGAADVHDIDDAALGAAVYLCAGDKDLTTEKGLRANIYRYNRSDAYVDLVIAVMERYGAKPPRTVAAQPTPRPSPSAPAPAPKRAPAPKPSASSSPKPTSSAPAPTTAPPTTEPTAAPEPSGTTAP
jgi:membrane-bound lytic murein transglycosylase B